MTLIDELTVNDFSSMLNKLSISYTNHMPCGVIGQLYPTDKKIILRNKELLNTDIDTVIHEVVHLFYFQQNGDFSYPSEDSISYDAERYTAKHPKIKDIVKSKLISECIKIHEEKRYGNVFDELFYQTLEKC